MFFDVYKRLCARNGKTPNGVAKELGFPSSSVTQWKKGSTPRPAALRKIAEHFGVSSDVFLSETAAENENKPTTFEGDELTEKQRAAFELISSMSDEDIEAFIRIATAMGNRG